MGQKCSDRHSLASVFVTPIPPNSYFTISKKDEANLKTLLKKLLMRFICTREQTDKK